MNSVQKSFQKLAKSAVARDRMLLRVAKFLILALLAIHPFNAQAQEDVIDFEDATPGLPGWRATGNINGEQKSWTLAQPGFAFSGSPDSTQPHSGGNCLKVEFTQDVKNPGIMLMNTPVEGSALEVSFFVRSEGIGADGIVSLYQYSAGERTQIHWGIAKAQESSEWTEVTCRINLLPDTSAIRFSLSYTEASPGAKVWIDDIKLKASN